MGIKQIASYLNAHSYKTQTGGQFYTSFVHKILVRCSYTGAHHYNQHEGRTGKMRPREEWITVAVPEIIPLKTFDKVQRLLGARSPAKTAPRLVNSPVLLAGLAQCGSCGGNLMLTTGKSGRYRYYSCAAKALKGDCSCGEPIRIPEGKLDALVTGALSDRLFEPTRLRNLLTEAVRQARDSNHDAHGDLKLLRRELKATDRQVSRLFDALTEGEVTDTKGFRDHQAKLEGRREELARLISVKERELSLPVGRLTNGQIKRFGDALTDFLQEGPLTFRKQYLRLLVQSVVVTKEQVKITGSKAALATAVQAQKTSSSEVPGFVREWGAVRDSNPRPAD